MDPPQTCDKKSKRKRTTALTLRPYSVKDTRNALSWIREQIGKADFSPEWTIPFLKVTIGNFCIDNMLCAHQKRTKRAKRTKKTTHATNNETNDTLEP